MKAYNGHRSWNAWNVSLWINNDELTYKFARHLINNSSGQSINHAIKVMQILLPSKTPDGADYNKLSIKLVLLDLLEN
tara:strand:+ start:620 stop:853 length:234 start_codon:yes stop_codon:yes gene_type:complete